MELKAESRTNYLSLLNVISTFSVVMLHTNGIFWTFSYDRYWITANIIESVMYFAVPVFFMLSGATLLDYRSRYDTRTYFIKRINKTLIPFLAWSLIGLCWCIHHKAVLIADLNVEYILDGIINTRFVGIYWFFIPLFSVYLSIPLFSAIDNKYKKMTFIYLSIGGFIINSLLPFVDTLLPISLQSRAIQLNVVSGYLLYPVIGYIISHYDIKRSYRYCIYLLGLLGLMLHICGTYYYSIKAGEIIDIFKGYYNVPCILYSVAVFLFFKMIGPVLLNSFRFIAQIISQIDKYTFSIYLIHWYVMSYLKAHSGINVSSIIWRVGGPFVIIPICIFIAFILRKIPVIKRIAL